MVDKVDVTSKDIFNLIKSFLASGEGVENVKKV